ncbi:alpha/beta hydrolase [Streptomyces sp. NBC_01197]|uniref:alpha/beta hydrolase n=1 Tax=Streptomyces sp. NBC_01197 TaxID=2903768 RepID=UPI003FA3D332
MSERRNDGVQQPALILTRPCTAPKAAVLLLHGGRADGLRPPPPWNLPEVRMRPIASRIAGATAGHSVLLGRVRYRYHGWNGTRADAAHDARRALDELAATAGDIPVVLVGHSMGGRAALSAAAHPSVRAVVGLAPWCPPDEAAGHLHGRTVVLLHGDRDRTTDPGESAAFVRRARESGARACALTVTGGDHAMLRRPGLWHALTAGTVTGLLELAPLPRMVDWALESGAARTE